MSVFYRFWIDKRPIDRTRAVAVEQDGLRLPSVRSVSIQGPAKIVFDPDITQHPQGWVETESIVTIEE